MIESEHKKLSVRRQAALNLEGCAHGLFGIIFAGLADTPDCHDGIAHVLIDLAPKFDHNLIGLVPQVIHQVGDVFGIQKLGHRGEVRHVCKQDHDLFALFPGVGGFFKRGQFLTQGLNRCIERRIALRTALLFENGDQFNDFFALHAVCLREPNMVMIVAFLQENQMPILIAKLGFGSCRRVMLYLMAEDVARKMKGL